MQLTTIILIANDNVFAVRNTEEGRVQVQGLLSKFLNCSIVELSLIQLKSLVPKGKE